MFLRSSSTVFIFCSPIFFHTHTLIISVCEPTQTRCLLILQSITFASETVFCTSVRIKGEIALALDPMVSVLLWLVDISILLKDKQLIIYNR